MKNITPEQIDNALNKAFISANENSAMQFPENLGKYCEQLDEAGIDPIMKQAAPYYVCINIAQHNMLHTVSDALKDLLCD